MGNIDYTDVLTRQRMDEFAKAALIGIILCMAVDKLEFQFSVPGIAHRAYDLAQGMLEERERRIE